LLDNALKFTSEGLTRLNMMHHIESLLESKINSVEQIGKSIVTYNSDHDKLSHRSGENRIHKAALERIEMHVEEDS
jgi:hypothetical protein